MIDGLTVVTDQGRRGTGDYADCRLNVDLKKIHDSCHRCCHFSQCQVVGGKCKLEARALYIAHVIRDNYHHA